MTTSLFIWLLPLPPLLAFFAILLFTRSRNRLSHALAIGGAGLSFLGSMIVFFRAITTPDLAASPFGSAIAWLPVAGEPVRIGVMVDPLTAVMLFFVAWTVLMIFIYSVGYHNFGQPAGKEDQPGLPPRGAEVRVKNETSRVPSIEPMYARFFAFVSLFAAAMYLLVVSDNLLTLYIGWEIMGLCSYLLIGFWYGKTSARDAAVKAFLTTRIGDMFMLLGMAALFAQTGTLSFQAILGDPEVLAKLAGTASVIPGLSWAGLIGLLLFAGTVGKSAQFPLHVWLPDAMEGPTPVSAMIHAATMVSAGVYLVARFFPLLAAGWEPGQPVTTPMLVMAVIGSFTALFAATIAVAQNDIKRVLAYSTISQLGYMVAALGAGAFVAAVFHLITHAFFKALLFLGSGSVIHGMEHGVMHTGEHIDPQDMQNMGGLCERMPVTFWTFLIGGLALAGFPLVTAGFWSKDEILSGALAGGHRVVFIVLALAALLTAFYTARQITLTFLGKPRTEAAAHAHESAPTMTVPLVVLAFFAVTAGWAGIPEAFPGLGGMVPNWLGGFLGTMPNIPHGEEGHSLVPLLTSLLVSLGGLWLGWLVYRGVQAGQADPLAEQLGGLFNVLRSKYYLDELYQGIFVRPAQWLSETFAYRWLDQGVIDGILHGVARGALLLGLFLRRFIDIPLINRSGDVLAEGSRDMGGLMARAQTGRIQMYMVITVGIAVIFGLIIVFLVPGLRP